jgi:hypothetical protein
MLRAMHSPAHDAAVLEHTWWKPRLDDDNAFRCKVLAKTRERGSGRIYLNPVA